MKQRYDNFTETVLIVDDEKDLREQMQRLIEDLGLKVMICADGNEALAALSGETVFCLVFSDFRMPGLSGVELCTELRKTRLDLPFVLVSGFVDKEVAVASLHQGVSDVLEKPFTSEALQTITKKYIDRKIEYLENEAKEIEEITGLFVEEATSLFEDLEKHILRLEEEPLDPTVVDLLFRNVHSVKGGAGAIPGGKWLASLGHSFESCLSLVKSGKLRLDGAGIELFLLTSDLCQQLIRLLKVREEPSADLIQSIESCIKSLDALKSGQGSLSAPQTAQGPAANQSGKSEKKEATQENEGVWVTNDKLDSFMKLSGELIVLKNYFQVLNNEPEIRALSTRVNRKVNDFSYSLNKITDTLQDQIMSIRKVTLDRALSKLPRIFRQVTKEVNKKVRLVTEGFDLGVDRTIANALSTCLTHMLRNAIDHGIETPEDRIKAGKPAEGTITINSREQKGTIFLIISDDGGGINRERVINKAVEKGLLEESKRSALTDAEAFDLLFLPGFSTAEKVTGISGRGVGMDVVKSEIVGLKGKIRIESQLGKGTSFIIEVPVPKTVMVEQTVLVKSGDLQMAVPLNAIAQLTSCDSLTTTTVGFQKTCQFQGKTVPLQTYSELARAVGAEAAIESAANNSTAVVILQHKSDFVGLLVDSIHHQLEAVIRPFDRVTNHFPGFKGTTVLGDDNIAYVIAPDELISLGLGLRSSAAA